eukprot:CCRYP_019895-RA/>CCRYP_019895-RA protein AED:0.30 eAED:0.32 QI:0/0/0/1/1/1/2/0/342
MPDENNDKTNGDSTSEVTALHDLIAGGVAGSASVVVGHPFDTIKVRLQTSSSGSGGSSTAGGIRSLFTGMGAPLSTAAIVNAIIFASYGSSTRLWEDVFEGGQHVDSELHGVGLMEGGGCWNMETLALTSKLEKETRATLSNGVTCKFVGHRIQAANTHTRAYASRNNGIVSTKYAQSFYLWIHSRTVQAFVICPMEHIKCRLQVQTAALASSATSPAASSAINNISGANLAPGARAFATVAASRERTLYKGPIDCGLSIIKNHGLFRGLYRGMGVTLWRETPAFGMYFATYDSIKARVENLLEDKDEHHQYQVMHTPGLPLRWLVGSVVHGLGQSFILLMS